MTIGNRIAPARFLAFLVLLPVAFLAYRWAMPGSDWKDATAMAFDVAAFCFLATILPLLSDAQTDDIRRHACENGANRVLVLIITSLLTLVAMAAISGELDKVSQEPLAAVKLVATLLLIWLFANTVYTLHYAHAFYTAVEGKDAAETDQGGLDFPDTKTPTYADFAYFAFTLGMTFQTSDVSVTDAALRKVALLHSFAAFVFNIGVIAFTINSLGGS